MAEKIVDETEKKDTSVVSNRFNLGAGRAWAIAVSTLLLIGLLFFTPSLIRHYYFYPQTEASIEALRSQWAEPHLKDGYQRVRCALHTHSYWSHDSNGTAQEIAAAANRSGIRAIFLADHPEGDRETYPRGIVGEMDGVLFIAGSERRGIMSWGVADLSTIDWSLPMNDLIALLTTYGAALFYSHTEKAHFWDNPDYTGMEIYNIHSDIKDEFLPGLLPNILVNNGAYPQLVYRRFFDRQYEILDRWESLNRTRRVVGIGSCDAHQNLGVALNVDKDGRLIFRDTGGTWHFSLNFWLARAIAEWLWGPIMPGNTVLRWEMDRYEDSFRHVVTYILLPDSSQIGEIELVNALKNGRGYVAFESLAPADGFVYAAVVGDSVVGIMGDSVRWEPELQLHVESPIPSEITLIGPEAARKEVTYESVTKLVVTSLSAGTWRVEASVKIDGESLPWVYTNPIYVYDD